MAPSTRGMKRPSPPQARAFAAMATYHGVEQAWNHVDRRCGIGSAKQGTDGGWIAPVAHAMWVWRHGLHGRNVQCACHRKGARHCMQRRNVLMEARSNDSRARSMSSDPPPAPTTSAYTRVWGSPIRCQVGLVTKPTRPKRPGRKRERARNCSVGDGEGRVESQCVLCTRQQREEPTGQAMRTCSCEEGEVRDVRRLAGTFWRASARGLLRHVVWTVSDDGTHPVGRAEEPRWHRASGQDRHGKVSAACVQVRHPSFADARAVQTWESGGSHRRRARCQAVDGTCAHVLGRIARRRILAS